MNTDKFDSLRKIIKNVPSFLEPTELVRDGIKCFCVPVLTGDSYLMAVRKVIEEVAGICNDETVNNLACGLEMIYCCLCTKGQPTGLLVIAPGGASLPKFRKLSTIMWGSHVSESDRMVYGMKPEHDFAHIQTPQYGLYPSVCGREKKPIICSDFFPTLLFKPVEAKGYDLAELKKYLRQALSCLLYDPVTTIIYLKALAKDAYIHNCRRYHWKCELTELVNDYPELRNPNADSYNEEIQKKYLAETASLARGFVPIFFEHAEKTVPAYSFTAYQDHYTGSFNAFPYSDLAFCYHYGCCSKIMEPFAISEREPAPDKEKWLCAVFGEIPEIKVEQSEIKAAAPDPTRGLPAAERMMARGRQAFSELESLRAKTEDHEY